MRWIICLLGAMVLAARPAAGVEPLDAEKFVKLHALIKPTDDEEKWSQIPWTENLWQARKRAAAEGKPILLWEMDGHPLGCV
jgi:hypothetical protein